jgi:hypothetical protein
VPAELAGHRVGHHARALGVRLAEAVRVEKAEAGAAQEHVRNGMRLLVPSGIRRLGRDVGQVGADPSSERGIDLGQPQHELRRVAVAVCELAATVLVHTLDLGQ